MFSVEIKDMLIASLEDLLVIIDVHTAFGYYLCVAGIHKSRCSSVIRISAGSGRVVVSCNAHKCACMFCFVNLAPLLVAM